MKNRFGIATAATLALFSLSACGSDDSDSSGKETSKEPSPTQTTPTQEATPTETATSAAPVETAENTPAGTELKIGDTAVVTTTYAKNEITVKLTVTEIVEGKSADLADLKLKQDVNTLAPFYVKVSGELVSGDAGSYDPATDIDGLSGDRGASPLINFGTFTPCEDETFESDAKPGDVVESCTTQIVATGAKVDGAMYSDSDTDYDQFDGKPLIWR
ncbi:MAG TPA: hypothetical protein VIR30_08990 [Nocardioides sp.]